MMPFMDENVIAAMARWPQVPDVHGWLSLSERGCWRLHPDGGAVPPGLVEAHRLPPGEPISNSAIIRFIDRNYASDGQGRWYFQNGPQRVFARLDAAPYVLHKTGGGERCPFTTHTGLAAGEVSAWWLDDTGRLYAQTALGPGLVAGRDLMDVLADLRTTRGEPMLEALEHATGTVCVATAGGPGIPLRQTLRSRIPEVLGFMPFPHAEG